MNKPIEQEKHLYFLFLKKLIGSDRGFPLNSNEKENDEGKKLSYGKEDELYYTKGEDRLRNIRQWILLTSIEKYFFCCYFFVVYFNVFLFSFFLL